MHPGNILTVLFILTIWSPFFLFVLLYLMAIKRIFEKAGYPGWKAFIPFISPLILYEIARMHPKRSYFFSVFLSMFQDSILAENLDKAFGRKHSGNLYFFFGLIPVIFSLGFGSYTYQFSNPTLKENKKANSLS